MGLESISTISCETRNNYDKKICENLNYDKISNFLNKSSYFDKNKYLLDSKINSIDNLSKEECAKYTIDNKYKGFTYNGDKNKCLIYNNNNLKESDYDKYDNYKKKTFLKKDNNLNIKLEDQHNPIKYFNNINNNKYIYENISNEITINNENDCLNYCLNNSNKCKAVIYMETPKKCDFYNNIKINYEEKINNDYDVYSLNKNKMKDQENLINDLLNESKNNEKIYNYCTLKDDKCILQNKVVNNNDNYNNVITEDNLPVYDCGGIYSTNPFCTKEYSEIDNKEYLEKKEKDKYSLYTDCINTKNINNIEQENAIYNNECKKKYGNEYVFDNDLFNMESKLECEDGNIKALCKLDFEDKFILESKKLSSKAIEHFNNVCSNNCNSNNNKNNIPKCYLIIIFLLSIIFIIFLGKIL
jgi:predicted nucleic acid-binding Zn ribbon protein